MAAYLIIFNSMVFHLVTKGPTNQAVLKYILAKYYANPDIDVRQVQPNTDSTDAEAHFGGWVKIFKYCSSPDMTTILEVDGYVIIQIDTDVCEDYGVKKREGANDNTTEQIIQGTKAIIIHKIGTKLYERYKSKIVFAICHESMECWLLPLYFNDNSRTKTYNCCNKLNQELIKEGFTIDIEHKKVPYYHKICKKIKNRVQIESMCVFNAGFQQFIQELAIKIVP